MSYRDRPRIWKTAYYLLYDQGATALPIGEVIASTQRRGDRSMVEFAIDLRALVPERMLPAIDNHYLQPSNEYRRIPVGLRVTIRRLWVLAEKRGLVSQGVRIVEALHG